MAKAKPYKSVKLTEEVYDRLHALQLRLLKDSADRLPKELRKAAIEQLTLSAIISLMLDLVDSVLKSLRRRLANG